MKRAMWPAMAAIILAAACGAETGATSTAQGGEPAAATAGPAQPASVAAVEPAPPAAAETGPIDGLWRCKMNGDIPLGTLSFAGGAYTFQTTNTAWEPNPNPSDGSGTVRFEENFVLPVDGPLKTEFEVTGAFGDGSFINFNTNLGILFGCRRP
jgi:hypothetical protein